MFLPCTIYVSDELEGVHIPVKCNILFYILNLTIKIYNISEFHLVSILEVYKKKKSMCAITFVPTVLEGSLYFVANFP